MKPIIKTCPYCGTQMITGKLWRRYNKWYAGCPNEKCLHTPTTDLYKTEIEAIRAINTRVYHGDEHCQFCGDEIDVIVKRWSDGSITYMPQCTNHKCPAPLSFAGVTLFKSYDEAIGAHINAVKKMTISGLLDKQKKNKGIMHFLGKPIISILAFILVLSCTSPTEPPAPPVTGTLGGQYIGQYTWAINVYTGYVPVSVEVLDETHDMWCPVDYDFHSYEDTVIISNITGNLWVQPGMEYRIQMAKEDYEASVYR